MPQAAAGKWTHVLGWKRPDRFAAVLFDHSRHSRQPGHMPEMLPVFPGQQDTGPVGCSMPD